MARSKEFNEAMKVGVNSIFNPAKAKQEEQEHFSFIPKEEIEDDGFLSNLVHMGGKLPSWAKGKITEVKDAVKDVAQDLTGRDITIDNTQVAEAAEEQPLEPNIPENIDGTSNISSSSVESVNNPVPPINITDEEEDLLGRVMFGESREIARVMSGEISEKELVDELEAIANVAVNRMRETGKTLNDVLTEKNAFIKVESTGVTSRFNADDQEPDEERKNELIRDIINKVRAGQLIDNTGGDNSFKHFTSEDGKRGFKTHWQRLSGGSKRKA